MSKYHVTGTVAGVGVSTVVEAETGAEAFMVVARKMRPVIGRAEQEAKGKSLKILERDWIAANVRLNVKQAG